MCYVNLIKDPETLQVQGFPLLKVNKWLNQPLGLHNDLTLDIIWLTTENLESQGIEGSND